MAVFATGEDEFKMYFQVFGSFACLFGLGVISSATRLGLAMIAAGIFIIGLFGATHATQLLMLPAAVLFAGVVMSNFLSTRATVAIVVACSTFFAAFVLYAMGL